MQIASASGLEMPWMWEAPWMWGMPPATPQEAWSSTGMPIASNVPESMQDGIRTPEIPSMDNMSSAEKVLM
jgi:hypothetical protein